MFIPIILCLLQPAAASHPQPASQSAPQPAHGQPAAPASAPLDWKTLEKPFLANHLQLTFPDRYVKAGENYFSPDGRWVVFQAVEAPKEGKEPDPFYAMFVARLDAGGLAGVTRVSPEGSANTCGWFHPTHPGRVIFGSTLKAPKDEGPSGYQRGTSKYRWAFPAEMEVVSVDTEITITEKAGPNGPVFDTRSRVADAAPVFSRPNYDAECSYDKSGRFILYAHIEDMPKDADPKNPPKADANIYVFDTLTKKDYPIVVAPGYDGGPFFSPSGEWICYRSDRRGNDELQLFVAKLAFTKGPDGVAVPTGIEYEVQITDNEHVSWCPYFHPSGDYMVYATSEMGHQNYEVFAIRLDKAKIASALKSNPGEKRYNIAMPRTRITHADGADVLPVFNPEGTKMLWCSQRAPKAPGEMRPSSQIWIADWNGDPFERTEK